MPRSRKSFGVKSERTQTSIIRLVFIVYEPRREKICLRSLRPGPKGAFSRAIFLWQRSIVRETSAKYLRSHTATKSLKEIFSKNLC